MKSKIVGVLLLCILTMAHRSVAQSCCCTNSGANWNVLPNLDKHVIGLRYSYKSYYSVYPQSLNPEMTGLETDEKMNTVELAGRFNLKKRLNLSVIIPVHIMQRINRNENQRTAGLGDMVLMLQYLALNPEMCNGRTAKHQLRLGAGIKLPSGHFKMADNYTFTTSLQLGTGSVDFMAAAMYVFRYNNWGLNIPLTYKYNTYNPQQFRFGDKLSAAANAFYVATIAGIQLMPNVGVSYDYSFSNRKAGDVLNFTGGQLLTARAGLDVYYKQVAFSVAAVPALLNTLNWEGELRNRLAVEAGVYYNF